MPFFATEPDLKMVEPIFDYQFRLILIGDSTVGKSSLLKYFTDGKFAEVKNSILLFYLQRIYTQFKCIPASYYYVYTLYSCIHLIFHLNWARSCYNVGMIHSDHFLIFVNFHFSAIGSHSWCGFFRKADRSKEWNKNQAAALGYCWTRKIQVILKNNYFILRFFFHETSIPYFYCYTYFFKSKALYNRPLIIYFTILLTQIF